MKFILLMSVVLGIVSMGELYAYESAEPFYYSEKLSESDVQTLKTIENNIINERFQKAENQLKKIFADETVYSNEFIGHALYLNGDLFFYWWQKNQEVSQYESAIQWYSNANIEFHSPSNIMRALYNMSVIYRFTEQTWYEQVTLKRLLSKEANSIYYVWGSFRLAEIMIKNADFHRARKIYLSVMRSAVKHKSIKGDSFKKAKFLYADLYRYEMGCKIGYKQFMKIYKLWPDFLSDNLDLILAVAPCFMEKKSYALLRSIVGSYINRHPDDEEIRLRLSLINGNIAKETGQYQKAIENFGKLILFNESSPLTFEAELGIVHSRLLRAVKLRDGAVDQKSRDDNSVIYQRILEYDAVIRKSTYPENRLEALYRMGMACKVIKNYYQYMRFMEYVSKTYPDTVYGEQAGKLKLKAFDLYAAKLFDKKQYGQLYDYYLNLKNYEWFEWSDKTYMLIAEALRHDELYPMAINIYTRLLEKRGANDNLLYMLGETYFLNKDFNEVTRLFSRFKGRGRKKMKIMGMSANAYYFRRKFKKAFEMYEAIWSSRLSDSSNGISGEDDLESLYRYAVSAQITGSANVAAKVYTRLLAELRAKGRDAHGTLREVYQRYLALLFQVGNCTGYLSEVDKYKKIIVVDAAEIVRFNEGSCLLSLGSLKKARELFVDISRSDSSFGEISRTKIKTIDLQNSM